jgi:hypothetical protein
MTACAKGLPISSWHGVEMGRNGKLRGLLPLLRRCRACPQARPSTATQNSAKKKRTARLPAKCTSFSLGSPPLARRAPSLAGRACRRAPRCQAADARASPQGAAGRHTQALPGPAHVAVAAAQPPPRLRATSPRARVRAPRLQLSMQVSTDASCSARASDGDLAGSDGRKHADSWHRIFYRFSRRTRQGISYLTSYILQKALPAPTSDTHTSRLLHSASASSKPSASFHNLPELCR